MRLRELTTLLASADDVDRLRGLAHVREQGDAVPVPVLLHVLHWCHSSVRGELLARVAARGRAAVEAALAQMLESDPPHPQSALSYLEATGDASMDLVLLSRLAQAPRSLQSDILQLLARTASEACCRELAVVAQGLTGEARRSANSVARSRSAQLARASRLRSAVAPRPALPSSVWQDVLQTAHFSPRERSCVPAKRPRVPDKFPWVRPPPALPRALRFPRLLWEPPSVAELAIWTASFLVLARAAWLARGVASPLELVAAIAFAVTTSRSLFGWPGLGEPGRGA